VAGPQFRSASSGSFVKNANSTVPVPTGVQPGDVVLIFVHHDNLGAADDSIAGFTKITWTSVDPNLCDLQVYWKRLTAADTGNYTFNIGPSSPNDYSQPFAVAYTRVIATGSPFDGTPTHSERSTSGTTTPGVSLTTTGPGRRIVHVAMGASNHTNTGAAPPAYTWTAASGYVARINQTILVQDTEQLNAGSTGSVSATNQNPSTAVGVWLGALIGLDRIMTVGAGVPTGQSFGTATVLRGTVPLTVPSIAAPAAPPGATVRGRNTVTVGSIGSPVAVPTPALSAGAVVLSPSSIATPPAPAAPSVKLRVLAPSIPTAQSVPVPAALAGDLTVPAIGTGQAFGTATLVPGAATVTAASAGSAAAFGQASVRLSIAPSALVSATAFGTATLSAGAVAITAASAASAAAVPPPWLQTQVLRPTGIPTAEQFGALKALLRVVLDDDTGGIPGDLFIQSQPAMQLGAAVVVPASVGSRETVPETVRLSLSIDPTARAARAVTVVAGVRYEALLMARVQQQSGPPTLLVVDPIDWLEIKWSNVLNQPQELELSCLLGGLTDPVLQRLRYPDRQPCELHILRDGAQVFAGPVFGGQKSGEKLTLVARGLLAYLRFMVITEKLWLPSSTDQNLLVRSMIDHCQGQTYGHFGIDTSDVTNSGVYREGFWPEDELHNVADRVEELSESSDGLDVEVDPATRKLQLWTPAKGVDRSSGDDAIVFDARNIVDDDVLFSASPGDVASFAVGTGRTASGEETLYAQATNQELLATFGRAAVTDTWPDAHEQATLQAHVNKLLDDRDQALWVPGPNIRVDADSAPTRYDVGDHVWFEGGGRLGVTGKFRVRQRTIEVDDAGRETGSLEFV